jgi:MFS transporter, Spinster family, sphingosine-1-phosphate transporter
MRLDRNVLISPAWSALMILCVVEVFRNVDRVLMAVLFPMLRTQFSLSDTQLGALAMAFALTYAVLGLPFGRWSDRGSRRALISFAVLVWSVATAFCGMATSYMFLFLGRVGVGVGEAGILPAAFPLLADAFPLKARNLAIGLFSCAASIGVLLGLMLGGVLASRFGWRATFFLLGAPGLLVALLVWFGLHEPKKGGMDEAIHETVDNRDIVGVFKALMRNALWLYIVCESSLSIFSVFGIVQWMPSFFVRVHHLSPKTTGFFFGITFGVGMTVGLLLGTFLATRAAKRGAFHTMRIPIFTNLALIPCYLGAMWLDNVWLALTLSMLGAMMGAMAMPTNAAAAQTALPAQLRGVGQSVGGLINSLFGSGVGPLLVGMLSDNFHAAGFANPLRYAISVLQIMFLVAAFLAWRALSLGSGAKYRSQIDINPVPQDFML